MIKDNKMPLKGNIFVCKTCGRQVDKSEGDKPSQPICCGEPMLLMECCVLLKKGEKMFL